MKIRLSFRKKPVVLLPYTGLTFCGCRYLNGDLFEPCDFHNVGRHRDENS